MSGLEPIVPGDKQRNRGANLRDRSRHRGGGGAPPGLLRCTWARSPTGVASMYLPARPRPAAGHASDKSRNDWRESTSSTSSSPSAYRETPGFIEEDDSRDGLDIA